MEGTLSLGMGGPLALYTELLCRWLKWAPPVHPHPTRGALAAALRDTMVEEDTLAQNVEAKFGGGTAGRDRTREGGRKEKRRMDCETAYERRRGEGKKVQREVDHAWCMTVMASVCRWGKGPNR